MFVALFSIHKDIARFSLDYSKLFSLLFIFSTEENNTVPTKELQIRFPINLKARHGAVDALHRCNAYFDRVEFISSKIQLFSF